MANETLAALKGAQIDVKFLQDVMAEITRARTKFPEQDAPTTLIAVQEELGELSEAYLDRYVIKQQYKKGKTYSDLYKEAVQVAVMAMRVALDCGLE
jgi:hypothetical protein